MALNRSDKSRILRRYFPGMTRNSEMLTEPSLCSRYQLASAARYQEKTWHPTVGCVTRSKRR